MENFEKKDDNISERFHARSGRVWGGFFLVIVGGLLLASRAGVDFPYWFFSWPMFLVGIGIFVGAQHSFRLGGWLIPIAIGSVLLIDDIIPDVDLKHLLWPSIIILIGVLMIIRPKRHRRDRWANWSQDPAAQYSDEDRIESIVVFGATKRQIITKNFTGGEAVAVFGGTELNLMQADFTGTITLELTQVFGGAKLIVPANWKIQSEVVSVFGSVEDKRPITTDRADQSKVLRLVGTNIFGGIDLKSY